MLETTGKILNRAVMENYAVAAANVGNSIEVNAAIEAAEELHAPLILDVLTENLLPNPVEFCTWIRARCEYSCVPLALNLDVEKGLDGARRAIQYGATSIMINCSDLPFEANVSEVKKITSFAHASGVNVEAELGALGPEGQIDEQGLASVAGVVRFVRETNADCLAAAIRINHTGRQPEIDLQRLAQIKDAIGNYPLVLHGTLGIPNKQIQAACRYGLNKINLSKDLKAAAKNAIINNSNGNVFDLAKAGIKQKLLELIPLYGSAGKA